MSTAQCSVSHTVGTCTRTRKVELQPCYGTVSRYAAKLAFFLSSRGGPTRLGESLPYQHVPSLLARLRAGHTAIEIQVANSRAVNSSNARR